MSQPRPLAPATETPEAAGTCTALPSAEDIQALILAHEEDPANSGTFAEIVQARRALAVSVMALSKREVEHPLVIRALGVVRKFAAAGLNDYPLAAADRELLADRSMTQWPNTVAAMLLGAAWRWDGVPEIGALPQWLWADYAAWLFAAPQGFAVVGDADRYAAYMLPRLEELARLVECNTGSAAVRAAGEAFVQSGCGIPLYFSQDNLRRHAEARGRIYKRLAGREATPYDPMPYPRIGRRLRIGFLNRHFGPQTETYTTLPTFESLDPSRFEVVLFSLHEADTELAGYCRSKASDFRLLPTDVEGQLATLRDANLDVLVFGTNVTAVFHEVTRLALYRIAPLQVVNNSSCITSGLPEIDLYVSGDMTEVADAAEHFSERLGLLPGPAHAFNYQADKQEPSTMWGRDILGIPEDAVVFATAANYYKIIPEMQRSWAKLLAAVPNAWLLVHPFNPNWSSNYPIKRFCADFDRVLAEFGVSKERLIVSTAKFASRTDVRELLSVADVYLDTFPFGGVNSLVDPLEAGVPAVVWEGSTFRSRMGSALLRVMELPELIATNEDDYFQKVMAIATDAAARTAISARIKLAMERAPVFLDPLAASDAFGDLVESAFDEVTEIGHAKFRQQRTPFRAQTPNDIDPYDQLANARAALRKAPGDSRARHQYGNALLAIGEASRAMEYLLGAIQTDEKNPALWYDLAKAFQRNGQSQQALEALEASLKLDVKNPAGWTMVAELAEAVGAFDMAAEANSVLQHLAAHPPGHATTVS